MKKTLLFTLLISVNLCSQEFWEIDSNSSFIKYSGNHFLHNWDAQNDEISGLLNIENGTIDNVGVIAKVKDFNSGNNCIKPKIVINVPKTNLVVGLIKGILVKSSSFFFPCITPNIMSDIPIKRIISPYSHDITTSIRRLFITKLL